VTYVDYLDRVVLSPLSSEAGPFARCGPTDRSPSQSMTREGGTVKPNTSPADSAHEAPSPFPPAFRWETPTPQTPTMAASGRDTAQGDPAQATEVLRDSPSYRQRPGPVHDLFRSVDRPREEPTARPSDGSAPPWLDSDLPPLAEQHSAWRPPGPEVFQALTAQSRSNQAWKPFRPRWAFSLRPRSLVTAGCLTLAAAGVAVAVPFVVSHSLSRSVPSRAPGVHAPVPISPAAPAAVPVTPTPVEIPTPGAATPAPADIPTPPVPNQSTDATAPPATAVPASPINDHEVTRRRSPTVHPAPTHPPVTAAQQPNGAGPDWASDAQPTPTSAPCTDCAEPTPTRTPTHWSPNTP
jgi:hypothetical protein